MTEQERQELSKRVAEMYGIDAYTTVTKTDLLGGTYGYRVYLHDDWQRLMPLAIEHELCVDTGLRVLVVAVYADDNGNDVEHEELYADHPTKERAVAVAILKALKAKKEK